MLISWSAGPVESERDGVTRRKRFGGIHHRPSPLTAADSSSGRGSESDHHHIVTAEVTAIQIMMECEYDSETIKPAALYTAFLGKPSSRLTLNASMPTWSTAWLIVFIVYIQN